MLIATTDIRLRRRLCEWLGAEVGCTVREAGSRAQLVAIAGTVPVRVLVTDLALLGTRPAELVASLRQRGRPLSVLLACDRPAPSLLLDAVEIGARGLVARDAPREQWLHAIEVVGRGQVWLQRDMLHEALAQMLHRLYPRGYCAGDGLQALTERQRQIARYVSWGMSNKEIGRQLRISTATVKTHMHNIFDRLGVSARILLVPHGGGPDGADTSAFADDRGYSPVGVADSVLAALPGVPGDCAAIHASTCFSSTDRGTDPVPSTTSWNARRSKAPPRRVAARSRSSEIFNWPIL